MIQYGEIATLLDLGSKTPLLLTKISEAEKNLTHHMFMLKHVQTCFLIIC